MGGHQALITTGRKAAVFALVAVTALVSQNLHSTAAPSQSRDCLAKVAGLDLQKATIPQLRRALASGRLTSAELVKAYLGRIRAYDPQLNSIRHLNKDALDQAQRLDRLRRAGKARGPLFGIPILLKDNVNTSDMPTTAGSIALKGSIPKNDAFITKKLEGAGAIVLGKLNLSEFAGWVALGMPPGYSSLGGQVQNAYSPALSPSGSSAGSGVAASMALGTATIGTETSGSILSPSNANSIVGIKPTVGLVSRTGILPLAPSFDTAGPMTRNVTDAVEVLGVIAGVDKKDPATADAKGNLPKGNDYTRFLRADALKGVRLGYSEQDRESLGPEQQELFDRALKDLRREGAKLVATDLLNFTKWVGLTEIATIPNEFKASLNHYLATETKDSLRVRTLSEIIAYNEKHPKKMKYGQDLLEASDATPGRSEDPSPLVPIYSARAAIDSALLANDLDAIVAPGPAYANVSAAAGYPTVMVPGGYTDGGNIPMGISFLGSRFTEPRLISYAYDYEQASKRRIPPTSFNAALRKAGC
jgi:amidase